MLLRERLFCELSNLSDSLHVLQMFIQHCNASFSILIFQDSELNEHCLEDQCSTRNVWQVNHAKHTLVNDS